MKKAWILIALFATSLVWQVACDPKPVTEKPAEQGTDGGTTDGTTADTAAPDTGAPDKAAPDASAPDASAPDKAAPDASAPDKAAPEKAAEKAPDAAGPDQLSPKQKAVLEHFKKTTAELCALYHERCCEKNLSPTTQMTFGKDKAECIKKLAPPANAPDLSRVDFDPKGSDACLAALKGASCKDYGNVTAACNSPYIPLQGEGDLCKQPFECKAGLYCMGWTSGGGKCQKKVAEGTACKPGELSCEDGTHCAFTDPQKPQDTSCIKSPKLGEACDNVSKRCAPPQVCSSEKKCSNDVRSTVCEK